ncbi:DUF2283 domain-containing protein [Actinosynnema sp. NPDC050436]|uniref:DUF2283 domain-containing protein n=1 Tax=Actinosynnema sp. NPDC050436 TaxID=3155659 RepID=UPI0033FF01B2
MFKYDREANAAYVSLAVHKIEGMAVRQVVLEDLVPGAEVIVDFDPDGKICGIEFLGASNCLRDDILASSE